MSSLDDLIAERDMFEAEVGHLRTEVRVAELERDRLEGVVSNLEFKVDQQDMELMRAQDAYVLLSDRFNVMEQERDHARACYDRLADTVRQMARVVHQIDGGPLTYADGVIQLLGLVEDLEDL